MKTYERVYEILARVLILLTGESLAKAWYLTNSHFEGSFSHFRIKVLLLPQVSEKRIPFRKGRDILLSQEISKQLNFPVYFNPDSTSTQLDAKHGMERQDPAPSLYLASNQGSAKGRFERHFHTSPHGGIYMSIHLKPNCHFSELPPYTMMVAASIVKGYSAPLQA